MKYTRNYLREWNREHQWEGPNRAPLFTTIDLPDKDTVLYACTICSTVYNHQYQAERCCREEK